MGGNGFEDIFTSANVIVGPLYSQALFFPGNFLWPAIRGGHPPGHRWGDVKNCSWQFFVSLPCHTRAATRSRFFSCFAAFPPPLPRWNYKIL